MPTATVPPTSLMLEVELEVATQSLMFNDKYIRELRTQPWGTPVVRLRKVEDRLMHLAKWGGFVLCAITDLTWIYLDFILKVSYFTVSSKKLTQVSRLSQVSELPLFHPSSCFNGYVNDLVLSPAPPEISRAEQEAGGGRIILLSYMRSC